MHWGQWPLLESLAGGWADCTTTHERQRQPRWQEADTVPGCCSHYGAPNCRPLCVVSRQARLLEHRHKLVFIIVGHLCKA